MAGKLNRKTAIYEARRVKTLLGTAPSTAGGIEADTLDGYHAVTSPVASSILVLDANADFPISTIDDYARGRILRGGATDWEAYSAKTDGAALVGDGTDVVSTLTPTWRGTHTWATTYELNFRDSALKVYSSADGQLDVDADTELELTAPLIDLVGDVNITGDVTFSGAIDGVLEWIGAVSYEPTGFFDRGDSAISFNDGTREFAIEPAVDDFTCYLRGAKVTVDAADTVTIENTAGLHFIYYDSNGDLCSSMTPWAFDDNIVAAATVYWTGSAGAYGDERHGLAMPWPTHDWMHHTVGVRFRSGLAGVFSNPASISIDSGSIYDEDIKHTISAQSNCRVFWRDLALGGGIFNFTSVQAPYRHVVSGVVQYDNAGSLADVDNNSYVAYWIFATNDPVSPIWVLMGQRQDTTIAAARVNNTYEGLILGTLPFAEMKLLYRVVLRRTSGAPGGEYTEALDLRSISNLPAGTYVATDHNSLTGRSNPNSHPATAISLATTNFSGLLSIADDEVQAALDTLDDLEAMNLTITGDWMFQTTLTTRSLVPEATDTYDIGSALKLYRKGYLSELDALVFAENTIALTGGWLIVGHDQGTLGADVGSGDSTIDFGKAMTTNDWVVMRALGQVEYILVGVVSSGTVYNVTRDLDGSGANDWPAGTPFLVLGAGGDGRIELNAYDTPRISMVTQGGAAYNTQNEIVRIGDLNGGWGYSSETYGIALGVRAASNVNITVDQTNGLRFFLNATQTAQWDASGNILVGQAAASQGNVYITSGALQLRTSTTVNAELTSAGELILGDDGGAQDWISISSGNGIRVYGNNTLLGQWTTAGKVIFGEVANGRSRVEVTAGAVNFITRSGAGVDATTIDLSAAGVILVGQAAASQNNIQISSGALSIRANTTERIGVTAAGALTIKNSSGNAVFTFDAIAGAEFTLPLTIGASGGIYQGTGTFASPTTGLKIWNDSGTGRIAGYNAGTIQWYANTDGKLYAGAGTVRLDASGVYIADTSDLTDTVFRIERITTASPLAATGVRIKASSTLAYIEGGSIENSSTYMRMTFDTSANVQMTKAAGVATTDLYRFSAAGQMFIGDTANAGVTVGLTINQGANDDEIFALKSSDVAHGATALTETDTFGSLSKVEGAAGGLDINGYKDSSGVAGVAVRIRGAIAENVDTTKSTAGRAIIEVVGRQIGGTDEANVVADGNVLSVRVLRGGSAATILIVDEDGDLYYDGSASAYDEYNDALMCTDLAHMMAGEYEKLIEYNRDALETVGVIGPVDENGRFMVSTKRINALLLGAVGQLYQRLGRYERALVAAGIDVTKIEQEQRR